jgi:hypothetical protein
LGPIQRRSTKLFKSGAIESAKFTNNINESGWEPLAQRREPEYAPSSRRTPGGGLGKL